MSIQNILVILISYLIGSLLPAELIAWIVKRKPCSEIGSGNPGFANIARNVGLFAGILVLIGDVGKTYLGIRLAYDFTRADIVLATSLLSLCALVTGHNFPLWNLFHGGKGVAVTCAGIIFITPTLGVPACLIGLVLVFLTGYLPVGAIAIPFSYLGMCFFLLPEAIPYAIFLAAMMLLRHLPGLVSIFTGTCPRVHPFGYLKKVPQEPEEEANVAAAATEASIGGASEETEMAPGTEAAMEASSEESSKEGSPIVDATGQVFEEVPTTEETPVGDASKLDFEEVPYAEDVPAGDASRLDFEEVPYAEDAPAGDASRLDFEEVPYAEDAPAGDASRLDFEEVPYAEDAPAGDASIIASFEEAPNVENAPVRDASGDASTDKPSTENAPSKASSGNAFAEMPVGEATPNAGALGAAFVGMTATGAAMAAASSKSPSKEAVPGKKEKKKKKHGGRFKFGKRGKEAALPSEDATPTSSILQEELSALEQASENGTEESHNGQEASATSFTNGLDRVPYPVSFKGTDGQESSAVSYMNTFGQVPSPASYEDSSSLYDLPVDETRTSASYLNNPAADTAPRATANTWKTTHLPSPEELRRHRMRAKQEIPGAKATSSLYSGSRHTHGARPAEGGDGVIYYDTKEKTAPAEPASEGTEEE